MPKPLGPKSLLIRQAITAHPDKGNKELAEMLNDAEERMDDKIKVTPQDIAQQKQAMKKAGPALASAPAPAAGEPAAKPARKKPGRNPGRTTAAPATARPAARAEASASPVDLIDKTLDLAAQAGGLPALKRLVERLNDMQRLS